MRTPSIHLNGTSKKDLFDAHLAAWEKLGEGLDALSGCLPNARDYYPQGDDAYRDARAQYQSVRERLEAIRAEVEAMAEVLA